MPGQANHSGETGEWCPSPTHHPLPWRQPGLVEIRRRQNRHCGAGALPQTPVTRRLPTCHRSRASRERPRCSGHRTWQTGQVPQETTSTFFVTWPPFDDKQASVPISTQGSLTTLRPSETVPQLARGAIGPNTPNPSPLIPPITSGRPLPRPQCRSHSYPDLAPPSAMWNVSRHSVRPRTTPGMPNCLATAWSPR